ncbi:MAG: hypothetical protein ABJE95_38745 [Byssovorax sp.]
MTLDEALDHWRRERGRLTDVDEWVDAGKPAAPPSLQPSLAKYARLAKPEAKRALKALREELAKDAFVRMFSAFEGALRAAFSEWLRCRCKTTSSSVAIDDELPSIEGVLRIAAVLEPRFDPSRAGYVSNVREFRNKLVHGGFASPTPYDLEELHRKLSEVLTLFVT